MLGRRISRGKNPDPEGRRFTSHIFHTLFPYTFGYIVSNSFVDVHVFSLPFVSCKLVLLYMQNENKCFSVSRTIPTCWHGFFNWS